MDGFLRCELVAVRPVDSAVRLHTPTAPPLEPQFRRARLKFSLSSFLGAVLIAALTAASLTGGEHYWHAVLRIVLLVGFLTAVLIALYCNSRSATFASGWAICAGVTLGLVFLDVPLIDFYIERALRRADPMRNEYVRGFDLAFSAVTSYFGGSFAVTLRGRTAERTGNK